MADVTVAPRTLETDALVNQNIATRQEIENWVNEQKTRLLTEKREHDLQSQEHERLTAESQRKREQLQLEHKEISAVFHDHESKVTSQQVEIEVLQVQKAKKEPVLRELFEQNRQKDEELKHLLRQAEHQKASWAEQLAELKRGLAMYEQLGLSFEQENAERIVIKFTQIDPETPERVFSFSIRMESEFGDFVAEACDPPIEVLPRLMEDLNVTADFSGLVRAVRREFRKLL